MLNWVVITLIALFLWAVTNIIDKTVISRYFNKPIIYTFFSGFFFALPLLAIPYFGIEVVSLRQAVLALICGILYTYSLIPYYYALFDEEVSRVMPVWQITPLFVLVLSYFFIGEVLTQTKLAAFALLLAGSILVSIRKTKGMFRLNKAFYLMAVSAFLFAIQYVLAKYVYMNQSYINGFLWIRMGSALAIIPLFFVFSYRAALFKTLKNASRQVIFAAAASGILALAGIILINYAISLNSVSLISAMEGIQILFVLILAAILSKWYPGILKEELGKKTLLIKIIAIVIIIAGVYLINV